MSCILEDLLNEQDIKYTIVDLNQGQAFPSPEKYNAVIVLGGPDSANDDNDKMRDELLRIREVIDLKIPYLGICLGLQTLVKAAGGKVVQNLVKEIGFRDKENHRFAIDLTKEGQGDPLFSGLDHSFDVFHLHGETVELTDNMKLLATGKFCKNQIVKIGKNAYGIQCHFELTSKMFDIWINSDPDLMNLDKNMLKKDFEFIRRDYTITGKILFRNFLAIAGF